MTFIIKSPSQDDTIRTLGIEKTIENYIKDNWNVENIPVEDVKFGQHGSRILQGGKSITLRCYAYSSLPSRMDISGRRWNNRDAIQIDVYVLNNNRINNDVDTKAIKIMTFLKDLFIINQGNINKGIFQVDLLSADIQDDPFKENLTHVIIRIAAIYIWDMVEV